MQIITVICRGQPPNQSNIQWINKISNRKFGYPDNSAQVCLYIIKSSICDFLVYNLQWKLTVSDWSSCTCLDKPTWRHQLHRCIIFFYESKSTPYWSHHKSHKMNHKSGLLSAEKKTKVPERPKLKMCRIWFNLGRTFFGSFKRGRICLWITSMLFLSVTALQAVPVFQTFFTHVVWIMSVKNILS